MNFIPVEEIPRKRTPGAYDFSEYKPMRSYLKEFMNMDVKYVRVTLAPTDYADMISAENGLRAAIRRCGLPIKVVVRGEDIYLMRTDKE